MESRWETVDGNEAVAHVAYGLDEVIAIYPITPASPMGELADQWMAEGRPNVWGQVPRVVEMQSEGGAAGVLHGAVMAGSLGTTFTCSQGLLLMIPTMYKLAGELTPTVIHVAARTLATHALSIFNDHSDVMAVRATGFAILASNDPQEAHDMACIAHMASLRSRIPFLHFFDGFRTSHEIRRVNLIGDGELRSLLDPSALQEHRDRGLSPDHPVIRGTAQNPDVFFQGREASNPYHDACASEVALAMEQFSRLTGRTYRPFEYHGHPRAEKVMVLMGSACGTAEAAIDELNRCGERLGLIKVRLFRPFESRDLLALLPPSVQHLVALDRTKEPGAPGEPLYQDVATALIEDQWADQPLLTRRPSLIGGRYGLSSKEFTPAMVKACFDEADRPRPRNHFTVGIRDDVTRRSLDVDASFRVPAEGNYRAIFHGLGSDGTVGANKNSIKILGEKTDLEVQGYFVYDSKKSGSRTVSHLRFGPRRIRLATLIDEADFIACHQFRFLEAFDLLEPAVEGAKVLLNSPHAATEVWRHLPVPVREVVRRRKLELYVVDAHRIARELGLGRRINTIMQAAFFEVTNVMDPELAASAMAEAIRKSYGRKGEDVVQRNLQAIQRGRGSLARVEIPPAEEAAEPRVSPPPELLAGAPAFVQRVTSVIMQGKGDQLPVSAIPVDGTWPTGTSRWEKRDIADNLPVWATTGCIQCNKCVLVCPHAALRAKVFDPELCLAAPEGFRHMRLQSRQPRPLEYGLQVSPRDCTGCGLCVDVCPVADPAKPLRMEPHPEHIEQEDELHRFFESIPRESWGGEASHTPKDVALRPHYFEYPGACAGCGETPYVRQLAQLFGDRLLVANATGCSSIYGGNLPTTPWTVDRSGRGPAWANSLFEDNAEFGLGLKLSVDQHRERARDLLAQLAPSMDAALVQGLLEGAANGGDPAGARARVDALKCALAPIETREARDLELLLDYLVEKSVWLVGGDGWAYDIGYGGLDHVLASGHDVNVLVLDTMVYSNTGGQMSKSTPLGAIAKFASSGRRTGRKNLGMLAISQGNVYVAQVAFGAKDSQTLRALAEAEEYPGPSLVLAYSHCIAHGLEMGEGLDHQHGAVDCGLWPLYRFDPRRRDRGLNPLQLDSKAPTIAFREFAATEDRFRALVGSDAGESAELLERAQRWIHQQWEDLERMAHPAVTPGEKT